MKLVITTSYKRRNTFKSRCIQSDEEKIKYQSRCREILNTLGLDLTDDSLKELKPSCLKMFVKEIFGGLNPDKSRVLLL
jgi:GTP cyclohydrolase I